MKFQYASDLHIEFPENKVFLKRNPLLANGEVLLLAGDIVPFRVIEKHMDFFLYCSDNFEATYWIPGNHEYYYFDIKERSDVYHESLFNNVHILNNTVVMHNDVELICSTMWSHIRPENQWKIVNGLNDFRLINDGGREFTVSKYNQLHQESIDFISTALARKKGKSIVLTHHAPTFYKYPEKYIADALNDAFAVELYDLIYSNGPDIWIYGHTHANTNDFKIGTTNVLTNQLGYVRYNEHDDFSHNKTISFK